MDYIDRSIAKNLKSGKYFTDVMEWYEKKYIYPSTERAILVILSVILFISSLITIKYTINIFPLKTSISVPLLVPNIDNDIPIIENISKSNEDANYAFAYYLLTNYVIIRESYNYNNLESQLNFIKSNSFKNIYEEFTKQFDMSNPDSLIYKYQNNLTSKVKINSVKKMKEHNKFNIIFTNIILDNIQNIISKTVKSATISFMMNDIEKKTDSLNFIVNEYKVNEIK